VRHLRAEAPGTWTRAGRLSLCCQLSEYGNNENDVVADLNHASITDVWQAYLSRLDTLGRESAPRPEGGPIERFPCIRCARSLGKMQWVRQYPSSPWFEAAEPQGLVAPDRLVALTYRDRSAQPV
jgi:hypothetical protein